MHARYVPPEEVKSPKSKWILAKVLIAGSEKKGGSVDWLVQGKTCPCYAMEWHTETSTWQPLRSRQINIVHRAG